MKVFYSDSSQNITKRLVYEQISSKENISQKADENLSKVSESVKESYGARLEMKDKLDKITKPISAEIQAWEKLIQQLKDELNKNPSQKKAQGEFDCLGKTITVVVIENSEGMPHQSYLDGKLLEEGFISWAKEAKKEQIDKPNA